MQVFDAKAADILRCSQRDDLFVKNCEEDIFTIFRLFGFKNYNRLRKIVPVVTSVWYYYLTSLSNIQTIGEEYTGTIRFTHKNRIPGKLVQILWIVFFVGGESIYDKFLDKLRVNIANSESITENARFKLLHLIRFLKNNKVVLLRLHYSVFYIYGKYYNISNRITGLKYILLRQWMQDDSSTESFNVLGKVSLLYLVYALICGIYLQEDEHTETKVQSYSDGMICSLCTETRKDTCATPCGHLFCWKCIHESLKYQQYCPICREVVHPSRIIFLQNYN